MGAGSRGGAQACCRLNVVILVPRRSDRGRRDRLWKFAEEWWRRDFPDWPIFEGHDDGPYPFNRALAVNRAAEDAGEWDVAHVIDADVLADPLAVRTAVDLADLTRTLVVAHDRRMMLTKPGTEKVLSGYRGPWDERGMVQRTWPDSVSCSVSVPRQLWDELGGMDELFVGWGFEDTAFSIAAEAFTGRPCVRVNADVWHLYHDANPDAKAKSPTFIANKARCDRYRAAVRDREAVEVLLSEVRAHRSPSQLSPSRIPRVLHRTVPEQTTREVEAWWGRFQDLHPGWEFRTHRDPLDPKDWPLTGDLWDRCSNGAQKAGLIRLEALVTHGGVYVDSDMEPFRSLEPLLNVPAFAAWEDETTVPDAVLGSEPNHPAFVQMVEKARSVIEGGGDAWQSGPGVTTELLPGRSDVLLLPPGAFYPAHYLEKKALGTRTDAPWVFAEHKWSHSWGSESQKASIAKRQR